LDLVIKIPIKAINKLSKELVKRDMLIPAEIILHNILEERADIPINAVHMNSGIPQPSGKSFSSILALAPTGKLRAAVVICPIIYSRIDCRLQTASVQPIAGQ
jgi:hypothetical protein